MDRRGGGVSLEELPGAHALHHVDIQASHVVIGLRRDLRSARFGEEGNGFLFVGLLYHSMIEEGELAYG